MYAAADIQRRWDSGNFIETGHAIELPDLTHAEWEPYEGYMQAWVVEEIEDGNARLIVSFEPGSSEELGLHDHPDSGRVITILEGSGTFVYKKDGEEHAVDVAPGTKVWMPKGTDHNFFASSEGLLVESWHVPFVPLNHPRAFRACDLP